MPNGTWFITTSSTPVEWFNAGEKTRVEVPVGSMFMAGEEVTLPHIQQVDDGVYNSLKLGFARPTPDPYNNGAFLIINSDTGGVDRPLQYLIEDVEDDTWRVARLSQESQPILTNKVYKPTFENVVNPPVDIPPRIIESPGTVITPPPIVRSPSGEFPLESVVGLGALGIVLMILYGVLKRDG